jgi:PAS domain S-box-containing protein
MEKFSTEKRHLDYSKNEINRLQTILNIQTDLIVCFKAEGQVTFINQSFIDFLGKPKSDLVDKSIMEILSPTHKKMMTSQIQHLLADSAPIKYELEEKPKGKGKQWYQWTLIFNPDLEEIQLMGQNITHYKQSEEQMIASERKYKALFKSYAAALFLIDKHCKITDFNKEAQNIIRFQWNKELNIGQNIQSYIYPEDLSEFVRDVDRVWRGEFISREKQLTTSGGSQIIWVESSLSPVIDEHQNIFTVIYRLTDITKRKVIENQIRRNRTQQKAILDNLPYMAWLKDQNGHFLSVNQPFAQLIDKSVEDIIGKTDTDIREKNVAEKHIKDDKEILRSGQKCYYEELVQQGSERKWFETYKTPIYDETGAIIGTTGISREITHRKREAQRLLDSEKRFRLIANNLPGGILFMFDTHLNLTFADGQGLENMNLVKKDIENKNVRDVFQQSFGDDIITAFQNTLRGENCILETHANQRCYFVQTSPIRDVNEEISQGLAILLDITQRKEAEDALQEAKLKAEEGAKAQSHFLSTMSHEIRTPLNAVIALTHFLLEENPRPSQLKHLNTLKFSSENLLVLINDILDYSKIESGKIAFEEVDVDICQLAYSIEAALSLKAEEKGVDLMILVDKKVPKVVKADPVRLSQILNNLIDNAIKFTNEGYVKADIRLLEQTDDTITLHFSIIDTGIGIPSDKLEFIFERFTQAGSDTTRKFGGTGLGLSITKKLLELQNSDIVVESELGKGSKFYFDLVLKKSTSKEVLPEHQIADSPRDLKRAKILMVEDNEINQLVASQFLQKWNARIDYAYNGEQAIDMIQSKNFDVILMDLEMPIMDGYETTQKIRELKGKYETLPIIALTASAFVDVKDRVFGAGMNDYVTKPFSPQDLYAKLSKNIFQNKTDSLADPEESELATSINYKKIIEISGGNKAFIRRYNTLALDIFTQFPIDYKEALLKKDFEKLRKIAHNIRATIGLLELKALEEEIQNGKNMITENNDLQPTHIHHSIQKVEELCKEYVEFIESKQI